MKTVGMTAIVIFAQCLAQAQTTFTRITAGSIVTKLIAGSSSALGDYDGDGFLDWFVTSAESGTAHQNTLFHNNRDGTFSEITNTVLTREAGDWRFATWGDFDNDGNIDLFVTSTDANGFPSQNQLFRNLGQGIFVKRSVAMAGAIVPGGGRSEGCAWADYDNDGWPDLFVAVKSDTGGRQMNFLYHNESGILRRKQTTGEITTDNEHSTAPLWADYDNDGWLDLFVVNGLAASTANSLYHNGGDGTFTKMTSKLAGSVVSDVSTCLGGAWGDYDNDGWLDLLVTRAGGSTMYLYHSRGDSTFERVLTGNVVTDENMFGQVGVWGDYDNDGFLDLFVDRGGHNLYTNVLYHNDGNSNAWIKVKCVGTRSNRSAIGTKVRVRAAVGGRTFWQLREINSFNGWVGTPLEAHFGLGSATNIEALRDRTGAPAGCVKEWHAAILTPWRARIAI